MHSRVKSGVSDWCLHIILKGVFSIIFFNVTILIESLVIESCTRRMRSVACAAAAPAGHYSNRQLLIAAIANWLVWGAWWNLLLVDDNMARGVLIINFVCRHSHGHQWGCICEGTWCRSWFVTSRHYFIITSLTIKQLVVRITIIFVHMHTRVTLWWNAILVGVRMIILMLVNFATLYHVDLLIAEVI